MLHYLVIIIVIIFLLDQCRPRKYVKLHKQIGNDWTYLPIIGNAHKCIGSNEDIQNTIDDFSKQITKRGGIVSLWLGYKFFIAIGDPTQTPEILRTALDKNLVYRFMRQITGNGSIFANGDVALRRRKVTIPTFALRHLKKFIQVFEANAKEVAHQLESHIGKGTFSAWDYFCRSSLDSVSECILGEKVGALKQPSHPFAVAFQDSSKNVACRLVKPWLYIDAVYKLFPVYTRQNQSKKAMYDFIDNIIEKKISSKENGLLNIDKKDKEDKNFIPFLDLMIESSEESGKRFTPEELREESLVLAVAGTDTSASGICTTLLILSQHQQVQDKVYAELQEVFGDDDKPINYEVLMKLKYVDAVIKEILRLYPPITTLIRDSQKDCVLSSGLRIPKNTNILVDLVGIQRNPKYWGDDADEFKPERFLSGDVPTHAYLPFSIGARNCPGNVFALLSIKTMVAVILRRYRLFPATTFKYDKDHPLRFRFDLTTKHINNYEIQIERRNKS